MKLWLLKQTGEVDWDEYYSLLVRAETEDEARAIAGTKNPASVYFPRQDWGRAAATCERVTEDGMPGIIIADNRGA